MPFHRLANAPFQCGAGVSVSYVIDRKKDLGVHVAAKVMQRRRRALAQAGAKQAGYLCLENGAIQQACTGATRWRRIVFRIDVNQHVENVGMGSQHAGARLLGNPMALGHADPGIDPNMGIDQGAMRHSPGTQFMEIDDARCRPETAPNGFDLLGSKTRVDQFLQRLPAHCLLYTSPSPRDGLLSRMPSSA